MEARYIVLMVHVNGTEDMYYSGYYRFSFDGADAYIFANEEEAKKIQDELREKFDCSDANFHVARIETKIVKDYK